MRGNVIGFDADANTGAIGAHDGTRYEFATVDWHDRRRPARGDLVDFSPEGRRATQIYLIEPEYVPPSFGQFLFSVQGRISRSQFWLRWVLPVLAITIILVLLLVAAASTRSAETATTFSIILAAFFLFTLWPNIVVLIKRIHDRNKSGWLMLLYYVPAILYYIVSFAAGQRNPATVTLSSISAIVGIWFFIEFGCMRGTIGADTYGPDPVVRR